MVVGAYSLDLYCDNERVEHSYKEFPHQFVGETFGECAKIARTRGWSIPEVSMITELTIGDETEDGGEITIRTDTGEKFVIQVFVEKGRVILCMDSGSFELESGNSVLLCS